MRILIIEDETKAAAYLKQGLTESGFVVSCASNGIDGVHNAETGSFDLIILDIMLPGLNGWSILSQLRQSKNNVPIVVLTACDDVADRVRGLKLGADDYLVKPFTFSELLARVRSVLRRSTATLSQEILKAGDLELNPVSHRAYRSGKKLDLTPKEFLLLTLFLRHTGEPLTRTIIAEHIWDMNFDCDSNVVEVHVRRLRAKVDDPFPKKLIHTVRGIGYVLEVV